MLCDTHQEAPTRQCSTLAAAWRLKQSQQHCKLGVPCPRNGCRDIKALESLTHLSDWKRHNDLALQLNLGMSQADILQTVKSCTKKPVATPRNS